MQRSVLITGGASGIGAAVANRFLANGDAVTVFDALPSDNLSITSVVGDVRSFGDNERAVAVAARDGMLDVLIANAGIHDAGMGLVELPPNELETRFRTVFDVNVIGYLLAVRAAANSLRKSNGSVVLTLSDASFDVRGNGAGVAYVAAKHACLGLLRVFARELAPQVRVNAVAPGGVPTRLTAAGEDGARTPVLKDKGALMRSLASRTLLGHGTSLNDLPGTYAYLCSPDARSITGQVVRVDGGLVP